MPSLRNHEGWGSPFVALHKAAKLGERLVEGTEKAPLLANHATKWGTRLSSLTSQRRSAKAVKTQWLLHSRANGSRQELLNRLLNRIGTIHDSKSHS